MDIVERGIDAEPARRTPQPTLFERCFGAAMVWTALTVVVLFAVSGPPVLTDAWGAIVGILVVPPLFTAALAWLLLLRRRPRFGLVLLVTLPCFLAVVGVSVLLALNR
ncbi:MULTISPECIES: hypothetical protein [Actinokineospora]|uniref:Uncharacterized protein n=1 Tax=Actinokineospora fastidiosa TaxID=1816 RepID=A0A918LD08_9PSEU|nr:MULTISPECIES: hypothetical protein [Actinokineospora]UVS79777.1 hypothetical protein Actkin_03527 [Actinokineospora sp. UTMC 2448]GGS30864.1 hypothetical protein GCM10010171_25690 [Actinokineospora fastidiosa]